MSKNPCHVATKGVHGMHTLTSLAADINREHESATACAVKALEHARRCGELLIEAKGQCQHGEWLQWLEANCSVGYRQVQKYMQLHRDWDAIEEAKANSNALLTIDTALALVRGDTASEDDEPDDFDLCRLRHKLPHVACNSGNPEWYTPEEHLVAVRHVLGEIDLDPASSEVAQQRVRAAKYFTRDDDGLSQAWTGRIFLNPPYATALVGPFVEKLVSEYERGTVETAICLTNNATDTLWFHRLVRARAAACFVKGRIKFAKPDGLAGSPLQGQLFTYLGKDRDAFERCFAPFGAVATFR